MLKIKELQIATAKASIPRKRYSRRSVTPLL